MTNSMSNVTLIVKLPFKKIKGRAINPKKIIFNTYAITIQAQNACPGACECAIGYRAIVPRSKFWTEVDANATSINYDTVYSSIAVIVHNRLFVSDGKKIKLAMSNHHIFTYIGTNTNDIRIEIGNR